MFARLLIQAGLLTVAATATPVVGLIAAAAALVHLPWLVRAIANS